MNAVDGDSERRNDPRGTAYLTPDQVHAFVGSKADYYLKRWERIEERGSPAVGFNWAAFFMQEFWLLYRGMYRWFWIAVAVLVGWMMALEGIVFLAASGSLKRTPWIFLVLLVLVAFRLMPLVFAVLFGVFGTYWYYLHSRR